MKTNRRNFITGTIALLATGNTEVVSTATDKDITKAIKQLRLQHDIYINNTNSGDLAQFVGILEPAVFDRLMDLEVIVISQMDWFHKKALMLDHIRVERG